MESDATYFKRRALEEHMAALKAECPNARRAHRELAALYEDLARVEPPVEEKLEQRAGIWI